MRQWRIFRRRGSPIESRVIGASIAADVISREAVESQRQGSQVGIAMRPALFVVIMFSMLLLACRDASDPLVDSPETRQSFPALGVTIEYPAHWAADATAMPYATCNTCTVVGPSRADYPYGVQIWRGLHQLGCQLTCYINIRALPQEATRTIDANGHVAFQQEFERQRPLGLVNEDGDNTSYREIVTVVTLAPIDGLAPEAEVPALFIDAFYRYGDAAAEAETRDALARLVGTLAIDETAGVQYKLESVFVGPVGLPSALRATVANTGNVAISPILAIEFHEQSGAAIAGFCERLEAQGAPFDQCTPAESIRPGDSATFEIPLAFDAPPPSTASIFVAVSVGVASANAGAPVTDHQQTLATSNEADYAK